MLAVIIATSWFYPDGVSLACNDVLARNDLLVIIAVTIQIGMLAFRLETGREVIVTVVFHIVCVYRLRAPGIQPPDEYTSGKQPPESRGCD